MTKVLRPYSRVYWEAIDDPKFATVWDDDACLAWWLRLLVTADMAWPASATLPAVPRKVLDSLTKPLPEHESGLVDIQGRGRFRIHGLDRERLSRGRRGSDEPPMPEPDRNPRGSYRGPIGVPSVRTPQPPKAPERVPSQDEPRTRRDETRRDSPPTPAERGHDGDHDDDGFDGPRGTPRANGTNPRAVAAREAARRRDVANEIQMRYLRGELTEDQHRAARAEAGLA